jgi:hypothetical protein
MKKYKYTRFGMEEDISGQWIALSEYKKIGEILNDKLLFEFIEWYSGMEKQKINNAYKRFLKEVKEIDP